MLKTENHKTEIADKVRRKSERRLRAKSENKKGLMFGLGMFGLVGWSVSVPAILGLMLGIWIDTAYPSAYSWTLMLLTAGIITGCLNAWYWVLKESGGR
ncbi:AtpZ/AtpI family protein [Balneola sp. MJW-20]|uniref:AtpZ/AtpI family protein n=1 Tax=Gracilimonas aurantiaca TaxID=3234185 RepID=UPI003465BD8C